MGYVEAFVVWEGALDEEREFPFGEDDALEAWAEGIISEGRAKGDTVEIFTIVHDHDPFDDGEDVCVQYLTSHAPTWTSEQDA